MNDRSVSTDEQTAVQPGNSIRNVYEWASTPPSLAVVNTVAEAVGCDPTSLDSLFDVVDPDSLNKQFQRGDGATTIDLRVSFVYHDHRVVVRDDGIVTADPVVYQDETH